LPEFLETVRTRAEREPSAVQVFFSTHPAPADRLAELGRIVPRLPGGTRDSKQFRQIRARLRRLPPAPSKPKTES
jgi:predicted Zn-dependent protease